MLNIGGFSIQAQIYESANSLVYRGIRESDNQPIILKLLKENYPTPKELARYRTEYEITKSLNLTGVVKVYDLQKYQNTLVMFVEDFGGESLKVWRQQRSFTLKELLEIAIATTETLGQIHATNIIHKDINPSNIVYHPPTGQLKIIDFGISTKLTRENPTLKNPNVLEGTLAYISPEQTGRMNRSLDYRTDFYSLGITFYELLTGKLPFQTTDPLELVHSHIAKQPLLPSELNSEIPQVIADIVIKLMAKTAEERYQSAFAIKADLQECLYQLNHNGSISHFSIAQQDISDKFQLPQKLYGRAREIETLLTAFERVTTQSEMILIAGYSGIGKTALVQELYKPITEKRGYFISGKFDQYQRNIPYSAIAAAFRELIKQLLSETETKLNQWRDKLQAALGNNGQAIIEAIPEVELIIGKQPALPEVGPNESQNRFNLVFQNFIKVFTNPEHPLAIFIDDLQWADGASLKLIQLLISGASTGLFLIGAYRDNEVSSAHPFMLTLEEIAKTGAKIERVSLSALQLTTVTQIIADTLKCSESTAKPLADLVVVKTGGNPFFLNEFLKSLYTEGLLEFDLANRCWQWNLEAIQARGFTDNVVELMAEKIQKLPAVAQEMLKLAACIGNVFDLETLCLISEKSLKKPPSELFSAVAESLVVPLGNMGDVELAIAATEFSSLQLPTALSQPVEYKFVHDRIQQAAYSLIPPDQKQVTHLKIGQLLQQKLTEVKKEEKLFDIVGHLNLGIDLIIQPYEREFLARLNLAAAEKARNATAYSAARSFVQIGLELLTPDCWQAQYELTLNLYAAAVEIAYLNADFDGMEKMAAEVLRRAKIILDKVKIYEVKISALTTQSQMLEAIAVGKNVLAQLGVDFSSEPDEALTNKALQALAKQLEGKQIEELVNLPVMSDPEIIAAMQLLAMLFTPILQGNPALLPLLGSTMVSLSLEFGNTPASTIGYAGYGMVLSAFLGEVEKGYCFGRVALSLLNRFNVREFKSLTLLWFGCFLQHRTEAIRAIIPTLKQGYLAGMETGDFLYAGYNIVTYFDDNLFGGVDLDAWEPEMEIYCVVLTNVKQDSALAYLKMKQQAVHNLKKIVNEPHLLIGTAYDEMVMISKHHQDNQLTALVKVYVYKLMLAYLFGNYTNALNYISQANLYLMAMAGMTPTPVFHFYAGLTYLALFSTQSENDQANILALINTHQTAVAQWAHHAPMNYQHKVDLIEAEKCRILGKNYEAGDWYDRAILGARENEYTQEAALAYELAAKFYLSQGKELIAKAYMQESRYHYQLWGATAKVKHLEQQYSRLLSATSAQINETKVSAGVTTTGSGNNLDITTVMKASQAISGEIILDKLLCNLMQILVENAGAQKGYLILSNQGLLLIQAEWALNLDRCNVLQSIPVANCQVLSEGIVNYVARTQESVVLNDATREGQFTSDRYVKQYQPKSVLCVPLINQGKLVSIVYLENDLTTGAFTPERLELLKLLSSQAAISIENAKLYAEVRENESRLTQFLEAMPVGVFILDSSGKPFYSNRIAQQLVGKGIVPDAGLEELAETYQVYLAGTSQEYPSAQMPVVRALKGESTTVDDIEIQQPDKTVPIEAWGKPIYDERGQIAYGITAFQDITERKRAEAERQRFTNELFQLNKAYERFVPNQFLQFLEKSSIVDVQLGDQVQLEMSVLFSDIRNFTTLSESMTPEDNFKFINSYLSRMEPVITENHGFIDKYIGDAIMALFSGEADNAVKAGIAMLHQLVEYNQHRANTGYAPIQNGIGINTGLLMLGTVGGQNRMDSTVISDAVNLASRVEGLTKNYGVSLLITEQTYSRLTNPAHYAIRTIETVKVKGKSQRVTVYEVFDADLAEIKEGKLATLSLFAEALLLYGERKLAEAGRLFADCWQQNPGDRVAKIYLERCQQ
ncbi:AAA family ATPase [Ancylothrix sp. C2]|uniref:AAA family ATPase n=1 Tax=Ancylothrix sp. D3o TaxID=2953691 RepID=UPI0021BA9320|nr:AAA family ATPase [Ancylothrix sp. D3o]MCT7953117.1 AAA family ATPase [Ancylothrix sp. D3o]